MTASTLEPSDLRRLADLIQAELGLFFDESRWPDLLRHLKEMSAASHFSNLKTYLHWLFAEATPAERVATLASHFTIGETYFFRDPELFSVLKNDLIPARLGARDDRNRNKITIWSAGCSSGEEPYSIAIAVSQLPALPPDGIQILASDVNSRVLAKAKAGLYTSWSFRNPPPNLLANYFTRMGENSFQLSPSIQERVRFVKINLMAEGYPSPLDRPGAVDLILCRNVLMYFDTECRARIVERLVRLLAPEGWFIVSPSETAFIDHPELHLCRRQGVHFFQKGVAQIALPKRVPWTPSLADSSISPTPEVARASLLPRPDPVVSPTPAEVGVGQALSLLKEGSPREACRLLGVLVDDPAVTWAGDLSRPEALALVAKLHADFGELVAAEERYRQAIGVDKLNPVFYFQLAMILQAQARRDEAVIFFKKVIFLDPDFLLAHFQLACLLPERREARKYLKSSLALAARLGPEEKVPHSDGITVGLLQETLHSLMAEDHA